MEILKVDNLTKIYGKGNTKVVVLDNVSFSVDKGEFVAIVGASGSGKSILLHLIGGVDRPTKGKVYILLMMINLLFLEEDNGSVIVDSVKGKGTTFTIKYFKF